MQTGNWRLSNHRFTIRVVIDAQGDITNTAPVAQRFVGKRFEAVCRWMQNMGQTDIMLMKVNNE